MVNALFQQVMFNRKVPKAGLTLPGTPFRNNTPSSTTGQVTQDTAAQIMQVDLPEEVDPFKSVRAARVARDGDKPHVAFGGKSPVLSFLHSYGCCLIHSCIGPPHISRHIPKNFR